MLLPLEDIVRIDLAERIRPSTFCLICSKLSLKRATTAALSSLFRIYSSKIDGRSDNIQCDD